MGEPDVTADDGAVADDGVTSENGGVGVDYAAVADVGVALDSLHGVAVGVELKAFSSKGYSLVNFNSVADGGGLADNDAGAVVDKEILADGGTCVPACGILSVKKV